MVQFGFLQAHSHNCMESGLDRGLIKSQNGSLDLGVGSGEGEKMSQLCWR